MSSFVLTFVAPEKTAEQTRLGARFMALAGRQGPRIVRRVVVFGQTRVPSGASDPKAGTGFGENPMLNQKLEQQLRFHWSVRRSSGPNSRSRSGRSCLARRLIAPNARGAPRLIGRERSERRFGSKKYEKQKARASDPKAGTGFGVNPMLEQSSSVREQGFREPQGQSSRGRKQRRWAGWRGGR